MSTSINKINSGEFYVFNRAEPLRFFFEDLSLAIFKGWCDEATHADLIIEGSFLGSFKVNFQFKNDYESLSSNFGFNYNIDASLLKACWFKKKLLKAEVNFFYASNLMVSVPFKINSHGLLNSVKYYNKVPLVEIEKVILESKLWDDVYYSRQVLEDEVTHESLILDYVLKSNDTGRAPCEHFNSSYYGSKNLDVIKAGVNPFFHYLTSGEKEGRCPSAYFDPTIYLEHNSDLYSWNQSLLAHFVLMGSREGRVHNKFCTDQKAKVDDVDDVDDVDEYLTWRLNNESSLFIEILSNLREFENNPLISLYISVSDLTGGLLQRCIDSVCAQSYENWELWIPGIANAHINDEAQNELKKDSRIKIAHLSDCEQTSLDCNRTHLLVSGEWIAILSCHIELHEHALYHVVKALNERPSAQVVYGDEDKINDFGQRFAPYFKPDWNPDFLFSHDYISHLAVYSTEIVKRIGGFREDFGDCQGYDLLLRYSREIDSKHIIHLPIILHHSHVFETTDSDADITSYTDFGKMALEDHFNALCRSVLIEQSAYANIYKVNWGVPSQPLVSLIIPTFNGKEITKQAIDSILDKTLYQNYEILLVDNNSDDCEALVYFNQIAEHPKVTLLKYPHPFNYSAINNFAARNAKGSIVGLINNDIEVITPEWLTEMVSHAIRDDIGCVGAMLYYSNDTVQHAGVVIGMGGVAGHPHKHARRGDNGYHNYLKVVQNVSAVTGACLLVKKSIFDALGGLNEVDLKVAYNDVDFCLRVQELGYRNLWTPYAELYHHESASRGSDDNPANKERFLKEVEYMRKTWSTDTYRDPYYSVNLSLKSDDMSIRV